MLQDGERHANDPNPVHFFSALLFTLFYNVSFFRHVLEVYPATLKNIGFLASLATGLTAAHLILFSLLSWRYTTKPVLILFLLLSSVAACFMDTYNVVIDHTMIQNILETNFNEAADLISPTVLAYFLILGVLPSAIVSWVRLEPVPWKKAVLIKLRDIGLTLLIVLAAVLIFSKFYTSFFREHKPLRYYANPAYCVYSAGKYIGRTFRQPQEPLHPIGEDARIPETDIDRELIILVVGEAARADHFSLNGYRRETNPLLKQEDVVSFTHMTACGTSTAYSVPCMFSIFPRAGFSDKKGRSNENLLDVLAHAGVHVLWRDNNSDSKGTALRVQYEDYRNPALNPVCDAECRDEGMLVGLQDYIDAQARGDILIVLHQMGNHGPAYYKRYPPAFEKFTPVCRTSQIEQCSREEIDNAYDNALLYTDYFLSRTIALLKNNTDRFEAALIYISDHGESLGEYGIYLHGLPYAVAPEVQKHIAAVFWFGDSFKIDKDALRQKADLPFSHDHLFHTMLGLMEVETTIYDPRLDITHK